MKPNFTVNRGDVNVQSIGIIYLMTITVMMKNIMWNMTPLFVEIWVCSVNLKNQSKTFYKGKSCYSKAEALTKTVSFWQWSLASSGHSDWKQHREVCCSAWHFSSFSGVMKRSSGFLSSHSYACGFLLSTVVWRNALGT